METIPLQEAQATLADVVHRLEPGEQVVITENDRPVAHLVRSAAPALRGPRSRPPITGVPKAGRWKGSLVVPDDFNEPLEELREYME